MAPVNLTGLDELGRRSDGSTKRGLPLPVGSEPDDPDQRQTTTENFEGDFALQTSVAGAIHSPTPPAPNVPVISYGPRRMPGARAMCGAFYVKSLPPVYRSEWMFRDCRRLAVMKVDTVICDRETPPRAYGSVERLVRRLWNAGASLNLIVGHTPDGLNRRRHDRHAIVLELHTEPQVDAVQFEEAPPERAAGDSD